MVPDATPVFAGLATLTALLGAWAVAEADSAIGSLNANDPVANVEWGPGLLWCLAATLLAAAAAMLAILPYCGAHAEAADFVASGKEGPEPIVRRDRRTVLAEYRAFSWAAVGIPGRVGTLCGLITWFLLMATINKTDWVRLDRAPSAASNLGQLASVTDIKYGAFEYCLERAGSVSDTMVRGEFVACFGYSDHLILVGAVSNVTAGASTVIVQGNMCDLLSEADFCGLKWQSSMALVLGIVAVWCGAGIPELTYIQPCWTCVAAVCSCAAAVLIGAMRNEANDKVDSVFETGEALGLVVIAVCFGMGGAVLGLMDFWLTGRHEYRSAPCVPSQS